MPCSVKLLKKRLMLLRSSSVMENAAPCAVCLGGLARERGLTSIALHCWADNERARRFYERCAFECRDVIPTADALLVRHSDAGELWVKALSEKNGVKA